MAKMNDKVNLRFPNGAHSTLGLVTDTADVVEAVMYGKDDKQNSVVIKFRNNGELAINGLLKRSKRSIAQQIQQHLKA